MDEIDGVIDEHAIENGDYRDVYEMGGEMGKNNTNFLNSIHFNDVISI